MKKRNQNQGASSSVTGEKGSSLIKGIIFALTLSLLPLFEIQPSKGQPPFVPQNRAVSRMGGQETWKSSDLALTGAQKKILESLQCAYASETLPLRLELMSLRFELRHLIRDQNVQPKVLLDRQRKISKLQARLDDLSLSYQIKARSIFTKEQLEQIPPDFLMGTELGSGTGIGTGKGLRKSTR